MQVNRIVPPRMVNIQWEALKEGRDRLSLGVVYRLTVRIEFYCRRVKSDGAGVNETQKTLKLTRYRQRVYRELVPCCFKKKPSIRLVDEMKAMLRGS
ncbi:hypothetical protein AVEN_163832-1 [Araneus ventricosus]|uniref:Uncharacterized protein n=1 Tax=Araneus ventricosus TaxID=182803 RepID=A0A4Y2WKL1_ARAVE|nr:hypothetical protein AVEN_163832-1 [Araneus ventricosus]